jgi:hypothetical protein
MKRKLALVLVLILSFGVGLFRQQPTDPPKPFAQKKTAEINKKLAEAGKAPIK